MSSFKLRAAAMLCASFTACAPAAGLYKSVGANGVVQFSDAPPEGGRKVERILIVDSTTPANAPAPGASTPAREGEPREADPAMARANARLDLAEHALAQARSSVSRDSGPMRMVSMRMSRADHERLAFYLKDVLLARQSLLEVLEERRKAAATPTFAASSEWVALNPAGRP